MTVNRCKIKICGVNDGAFAREAERLGADYIGLIFAEGSPRRVTPSKAREIIACLSGRARLVGVFTSTPVSEIASLLESLGIGIAQLHRRASEDDVAFLRARGFTVWALAGGAEADAMLFDSSHGDGEIMMRKISQKSILAGGISVENVGEAIASGADVIDVSGSLESSPGVKSIARLQAFMSAVR